MFSPSFINEIINRLEAEKLTNNERQKLIKLLNEQLENEPKIDLSCIDYSNSWVLLTLAHCYYNGYTVEVDNNKAIELFNKSINLGNSQAMVELSLCYEFDNTKYKEVIELLNLASVLFNTEAMNLLGKYYQLGIGVEKNINKTIEMYELAIKNQDYNNVYKIVNLYQELGENKKASELYKRAILYFQNEDIDEIENFLYENITNILKINPDCIYEWYTRELNTNIKNIINKNLPSNYIEDYLNKKIKENENKFIFNWYTEEKDQNIKNILLYKLKNEQSPNTIYTVQCLDKRGLNFDVKVDRVFNSRKEAYFYCLIKMNGFIIHIMDEKNSRRHNDTYWKVVSKLKKYHPEQNWPLNLNEQTAIEIYNEVIYQFNEIFPPSSREPISFQHRHGNGIYKPTWICYTITTSVINNELEELKDKNKQEYFFQPDHLTVGEIPYIFYK